MRYSLLSRFQGALLGSLIGESLGRHHRTRQFKDFQGFNLHAESLSQLSQWSQIALCAVESLLDRGVFDCQDWMTKVASCSQALWKGEQSANSGETALASLPIVLFFHQNWALLRGYLLESACVWQTRVADSEALLTYAWVIALALRETLTAENLITQRPPFLTVKTSGSGYLAHLQEVLATSTSLEMAIAHFNRLEQSQSAIALALLCCYETPEDFHLCITRAVRASYQPEVTAALAGALAGAYNSLSGISLGWRLGMQQTQRSQWFAQGAEQLFAAWCGVYQPTESPKRLQRAAVALPNQIQPRASLKIISQKE